jgi:hypothetical protein
MANKLVWYDSEKTIAVIEQEAGGSWALWYEIVDMMMEVVENSPHKVHFILANTTGIPAGNPIPHFKRTVEIIGPNEDRIGAIVIVGGGSIAALVNAFLGIVLKAAKRSSSVARFATSIEDAVKLIEATPDF